MPRCWRNWASALAVVVALAGCGGGGEREPEPERDTLRYGVVGDSYSNGEGLSPELAWPVMLAGRLDAELVLNAAVSGFTTEDALLHEVPALQQADPEVATVMIGANDVFDGDPPSMFRARFRRLLAEVVRIVGGARRVVAVTIPDFTRKPDGSFGDPAAIQRFNAVIRAESARQDVAIADVFPTSRLPTDPSPDGLHPSERELAAWADAIEPVARRAWAGLR